MSTGAAIAVLAWDQLFTLATTTDGAEVVVVTEDGEDGSRTPIAAYRDGLPYHDADVRDACEPLRGVWRRPLARSGGQSLGLRSTEPTSHAPDCGRAIPRWSVVPEDGQSPPDAPTGMAFTAGLVGRGTIVCVGPP